MLMQKNSSPAATHHMRFMRLLAQQPGSDDQLRWDMAVMQDGEKHAAQGVAPGAV